MTSVTADLLACFKFFKINYFSFFDFIASRENAKPIGYKNYNL
ncbi:hypothetical protein LL01C5_47450 [Escherichia coli]|nr:hypothetical protein IPCEC42_00870 [Escherichia coli]BDR46965.1 hypothetical protein IPCEC48_00900 [Escherichia coli]GJH52666.1 hypothetical protein ECZC02_34790 [Escherichia coli]GJH80061.1 hypothetical protein ECZC07_39830 [Escherichia coli]GJH83547.1 hypothetical protein ECZC08_21170 [Escherichia coli]